MLHKRKYYPFFVLLMICCHLLTAQPPAAQKKIDTIAMPSISSTVKVGEIVIAGNKKTKKSIILREIPFKPGEEYSLDEIVKKFETARRQLMNTALFNAVIVAAKNLLEKEKQTIISARLSVTGLNHASPTEDTNMKDAEDYYNQTYSQL